MIWFSELQIDCMQQEQDFDGAVIERLRSYSLAELEHLFLEFYVELTAVSALCMSLCRLSLCYQCLCLCRCAIGRAAGNGILVSRQRV